MKKNTATFVILALMSYGSVFAETLNSNSEADMAKAYQEGKKAGVEALNNQKMWQQGQGDPKMAEAYQQGLNTAENTKKNQEKWENSELN